MTTPAQYEAAIRWLEEVVAELDPNTRRRDAAPHLEPRTTQEYRALHSAAAALAIVREAREVAQENARLRERVSALSWAGQIDHMSGAHNPRDRHEMGG